MEIRVYLWTLGVFGWAGLGVMGEAWSAQKTKIVVVAAYGEDTNLKNAVLEYIALELAKEIEVIE